MNFMLLRSGHTRCLCVILITSLVLPGCVWTTERHDKMELGVDPQVSALAGSASYKDTIGSKASYQGIAPLRVRGIGIVVGLGDRGTTTCPRNVYERLLQNLNRHYNFSSSVVGTKDISPERLISDKDTAVVLVRGEIPPAATVGDRFDILVSAWPGTETTSLRGGRLYTTNLEIYRQVSPNQSISGQTVGRAAGPLFLNPFSGDNSATKTNELEGLILGGGLVTQDRRIRLVLFDPSYQMARRIQDQINAFAPGTRKIAAAESPSYVKLTVPPAYRDDTGHFLNLIQTLYLSRDPKRAAVRTRALAQELVAPNTPHGRIALALEAIGPTVLPALDELYKHPEEHVRFYAAATGLRLDDHVAGDVMIREAEDPNGKFRLQAIRALGATRGMGSATMALRRLLDDADPRVQTEAYEALVERHDPSIDSTPVGGDNFHLDVIPTSRPAFIYVKRRIERRIALFGKDLMVSPPVVYLAPDGSLTASARPGDEHLALIRTVVATGDASPAVPGPLRLPELIKLLGNDADVDYNGNVTGMSVKYGGVVRLLYHLCQNGAIDANFVLETANVLDLFGPLERKGRPESEIGS